MTSIFVTGGLVPPLNAVLIRGAGVDLDRFHPAPEPPPPVTVLLPARMLRDKGVFEFLAAAKRLGERGLGARFLLAGGVDSENPAAISEAELRLAAQTAGVQWLGHRTDMASLLGQTHVVCLPSYREGLPLALLEAAAAGKAIVATDVPGCREIVIDGLTGLLVRARDVQELATALEALILDPELRGRLGAEARAFCAKNFGVEAVIKATLELYAPDSRPLGV